MTCQRAASICCLRSLLDNACDSGTDIAKEEESCPSNINVLGGGLKKECCDCCLLAKDLLSRNEPCVAPVGFSAGCLRSFNKCCNGEFEITHATEIITGRPLNDPHVMHGDRCASANCEHLCHDRGGEKVECSCRSGFDLAPDGLACIDIDECATLMDDCLESQRCLNTPGSFKCIRTLSCGTGYAMDSATEQCRDVDECNLGSHDCGALYQCRNTQGSYRCDPKKCGDGELQNPMTGECTSITCPHGYFPKNGMCNDIDECQTGHNCGAGEECVNTPGSFRCQQKGNLCAHGYEVNDATGFCEDVNECQQGVCGSMECINLPGTYKCKCGSGYEFNDAKKRCEDIDECIKFAGHVCDLSAECINTIGSFECKCKPGFQLASDGRRCEDVNECTTGIATCEQKCVNIPGSYQCICDRGFALGPDGTKCEDIDECSIWAGSGNDLCMGGCINTKGSYLCQCPPGYKIQPDGRTCVDVDECAMGECSGSDKVCVNTLGSFKCHSIDCPTNYIHDSLNKNQIADGYSCIKVCSTEDTECLGNHTREVLYQFRAVPSLKEIITPIEVSRIVTHMGVPFSVDYSLDYVGKRHFQIVQERNVGIVKLVKPIRGPTVETIKVNIHTKSRTGVILAFNEAIIEISVSKYSF
ncbi:CBN-FBL-1 protein [Caenorhabditis brenneri]|uniref:Fibulin-1 n=1 Tax=Caenorhabditis brenneri TaxID=135651 RepID=G0NRB0_CAEBE|nr:CBN-FBL-1 protein [Caenorhabditis brenneri]